jgi:dCTP deaminase
VLLSDRDLGEALAEGSLVVEPLRRDPDAPSVLQPASLDLTLGRQFRVFTSHLVTAIDPRVRQDDLTRLVEVGEGEPFVLHPGEFALGATAEVVALSPALAARLEGKSSLGRLGLLVHSTAGFVDPGFAGVITLELSNVASLPILLWPGMRIGQLCVFQLLSAADRPYGSPELGSRYQDQDGPVASRSWRGC